LAEREFGVYTSQTAKTFSSFTVISLVDPKKVFFPSRSRSEKVLKFCPLAEKRGSLEGARERGVSSSGVGIGRVDNQDSKIHYFVMWSIWTAGFIGLCLRLFGIMVSGLELKVWGKTKSRFKVQGSRFKVQGLGFRVRLRV